MARAAASLPPFFLSLLQHLRRQFLASSPIQRDFGAGCRDPGDRLDLHGFQAAGREARAVLTQPAAEHLPARPGLEGQRCASPNTLSHVPERSPPPHFGVPPLPSQGMEMVKKKSPKTRGSSPVSSPSSARPGGWAAPRVVCSAGPRKQGEKLGAARGASSPACVYVCRLTSPRRQGPGQELLRAPSVRRRSSGVPQGWGRAGTRRCGHAPGGTYPRWTRPRPSPAVPTLLPENR